MNEELTALKQVIEYQCSCEKVIDSLQMIHDNPGCSGDIEDIEDIIGAFNYYQPRGKHICELDNASRLFKNDLFLVSQLSSNSNRYQSRKCNYAQLKTQLLEDLMKAFNLGTMAYESKFKYALTSHNHDAMYNLVSWNPNPAYQIQDEDKVSCLGKIYLSTETLQTTDISTNPLYSEINVEALSINCPKYEVPFPPSPLVGTLRFVSSKSIQDLIDKNLINYDPEGDVVNVNPYDSRDKIRDDFDGWVFPDGSLFYNHDNQLSDAAFVFSEDHDPSKASFFLPSLENFFQACGNPDGSYSIDMIPATLGLAVHSHVVKPLQLTCNLATDLDKCKIQTTYACGGETYIHRGNDVGSSKWFSFSSKLTLAGAALTDLATSEAGDSNEKNYQPKHNLIPVMIYIGGVTRRYYENLA